MNIYTFYESIDPSNIDKNNNELKIIDLWSKSWRHNGWNPIILNLNDASDHPEYQKFYDVCYKFPTVNPKKYEMYCYLRWLAMELRGGWHCDYDVINYGFKPVDFGDKIVTCINGRLSPSTIYMTKEKYRLIIDTILNYKISDVDIKYKENNNKIYHVSDMTIIQSLDSKYSDVILNIEKTVNVETDWDKSNLIHFASAFIRSGKSKLQTILEHYKTAEFLL